MRARAEKGSPWEPVEITAIVGGRTHVDKGNRAEIDDELSIGGLDRLVAYDPEEMLARCVPLLSDPDRMRGIGHAALDVLRAEPRTDPDRIAAVGYGTGGAIGLELGRDGVNLRAIGTVNATITGRPGEAARIRCPVWAGVGSEDPIMSPAQRNAFTAEMQAAGVDWRLTVYGGALHAFHHPPVDHPTVPGVGHHPQHARRAWRDVVDLLAECLPVTEDQSEVQGRLLTEPR